jgi:hypothetical protein
MKNTKSVSKKSASKSTKSATKKVVKIDTKILSIPCPVCKAKVSKPCVFSQNHPKQHIKKGATKPRPHLARKQKAYPKLAPKKVVLKVKAKVQPIKTKKSA